MSSRSRVVVAAIVAALASFSLPAVADHEPDPWLGRVLMHPHPLYEEGPMPLEAEVVLNGSVVRFGVEYLLFGAASQSDHLQVTLEGVFGPDGIPLPVAHDERSMDPRKPRFHVAVDDVPLDVPLRVLLEVRLAGPGIHHVGVFVVGFDQSFEPVVTRDGERAELYGFSEIRYSGQGWLSSPVAGRGNSIGLMVVLVVVAVAFVRTAVWASKRWL